MYLYNDKVKHASLNNLQIILGNVRSSSTFQHLIPCNLIMINLSLYIFTRGLIYKQWHNMSTRGTTQIRALNNTKTIAILKRSIVTRSQFHAAPNFPFLISWIFFYGISIVIHITKIWMFKVRNKPDTEMIICVVYRLTKLLFLTYFLLIWCIINHSITIKVLQCYHHAEKKTIF